MHGCRRRPFRFGGGDGGGGSAEGRRYRAGFGWDGGRYLYQGDRLCQLFKDMNIDLMTYLAEPGRKVESTNVSIKRDLKTLANKWVFGWVNMVMYIWEASANQV